MSFAKLRGRIIEKFGTNKNFAAAMEINLTSISHKLNNKSPWKREEIEKACTLLDIPIDEVHLYFFDEKY